jgi:hypothetical protein
VVGCRGFRDSPPRERCHAQAREQPELDAGDAEHRCGERDDQAEGEIAGQAADQATERVDSCGRAVTGDGDHSQRRAHRRERGYRSADEAVRAELAAISDTPAGRLRMTTVQTPALALLPATLDRLAATAPDPQIEVHQREAIPALEDLRSRAVDLVVGIEYDPVPVARQRDINRRDGALREAAAAIARDRPDIATLAGQAMR